MKKPVYNDITSSLSKIPLVNSFLTMNLEIADNYKACNYRYALPENHSWLNQQFVLYLRCAEKQLSLKSRLEIWVKTGNSNNTIKTPSVLNKYSFQKGGSL